jgi:hypothetical protein
MRIEREDLSARLVTTRQHCNEGVRPPIAASRVSELPCVAEWSDDDFDVLADGVVVGRIFKANATPVGMSWMWTLAFGHHEDRTPTHGYAATREDAMAAFAKSWRRECWARE